MKDNISEDEVFEDYQDGLPEDFQLAGALIRRKEIDLSTTTVQIALNIDYDLLKEIKQAADQKRLPYQVLITQILRDHITRRALEGGIKQ